MQPVNPKASLVVMYLHGGRCIGHSFKRSASTCGEQLRPKTCSSPARSSFLYGRQY
jgi:hypothetical protein